jgi:hypothetical protein
LDSEQKRGVHGAALKEWQSDQGKSYFPAAAPAAAGVVAAFFMLSILFRTFSKLAPVSVQPST